MSHRTLLVLLAAVGLALAACGDDDPVTDPTIFPTTPTATAPFTTPPGVSAPAMPPATSPPATDGPTTAPPTGTPGGPAGTTFTTCEADRFSIGYPQGWWVNEEHEAPPCSLYHPEPLDVAPENYDAAVFVTVDAVAFEEVLDAEQSGQVHNSEELTIDGQRAQVVERTSSGQGQLPEGERSYTYLVDLGDATLIAATYTVGDTDFAEDRTILDAMIDTLAVEAAG